MESEIAAQADDIASILTKIDSLGIWTAIAAICAFLAVIISIIALAQNGKTLRYTVKDNKPHLTLLSDILVLDEYEFSDNKYDNGIPKNVPGKSAVLSYRPLDNALLEQKKIPMTCIILNTSDKDTTVKEPDFFSKIFGRIQFKNEGVSLTEIELTKCTLFMRQDYYLGDKKLDSIIELNPVNQNPGSMTVNKGGDFIVFISYLYDLGERMLCDHTYVENAKLQKEAMDRKRAEGNQIGFWLPVIIDLYDRFCVTLKYKTIKEETYTQDFEVRLIRSNGGGTYNPVRHMPKRS